MAGTISISVVVCTYNRARHIRGLLESLTRQTADARRYEVIVVDNNSTDETRTVVEEFGRLGAELRYFLEEAQGLSRARNRGWREAHGEYVAYIDDDARAPDSWLQTALSIIDRMAPDVFGGPYFPFYETDAPRWWKDEYLSYELAELARPLEEGEYICGGNMVIRRRVIRELSGFDTALGMNGEATGLGEETDFQRRIRAMRPDAVIYYDPSFYVHHLAAPEKMTIGGQFARRFAAGRMRYRLSRRLPPQISIRLYVARRLAVLTSGLLVDVGRSLAARDRSRFPFVQNYLYEHSSGYLERIGYAYERWLDASGRSPRLQSLP